VLAVAAAVLLGVALRLPFLTDPLEPDEAGYLLVARQWHPLDPHLYGRLWVDRPPLLILLFRLADGSGPYGVRALGVVAVAVLATAAGVAGGLVSGRRDAITAALVAGTLASSYAIGGQEVDGELLGAPLVMVCCALTLLALRRPGVWPWLGALAGVAGTSALLVKQNLADGLVFAFVVLVTSRLFHRRTDATRVLVGGVVGIAAVTTAVLTWAWVSGVGLGQLAFTLYGFRAAADAVIGSGDTSRPLQRAAFLGAVAVLSGVAALLVLLARGTTRRLPRRDPLAYAVLAMAVYGVIGIVAGGSYWTHYLIELVPALSLGAAMAGGRRVLLGVVTAAVLAAGVGVALGARTGRPEATATTTARVLREASRPGDGVVVTYGHANLVEASGLATPYPYLWSLPLRVRDPHLTHLTRLLGGRRAPTWVVEYDGFDSWGIDESGRLASSVRKHYEPAATVCGHLVWLHDGRPRTLPRRPVGPCGEL
jgi:hypothetical protein